MVDVKVIFGIGNPGKEYDGTRHNIGFALIDRLAAMYGIACTMKKWHALAGEAPMLPSLGRGKLLLVKPQTYVNISGKSMQAILAFYKIPPEQCLVLVDDLNLELGTLRGRAQGSAGGHNGLKDIERCLGQKYPRLRMGIGSSKQHQGDQINFVLGKFHQDEQTDVNLMTDKAVTFCETWLRSGIGDALALNGPLRPKPKKEKQEKVQDDKAQDAGRESLGEDVSKRAE